MQGAAKGCSGASGASVQAADNGVSVAATLTQDELIGLHVALDVVRDELGGALTDGYRDNLRDAQSALHKLLAKTLGAVIDVAPPTVAEWRAEVARKLRAQLLDETPTNRDPNQLAMVRDAGYRAGWNDRARSLASELEAAPQSPSPRGEFLLDEIANGRSGAV
jgi:hypothetical protein